MNGKDHQRLVGEGALTRVLSQETIIELQDVADHVREHRNFELVSDRAFEEHEDDLDPVTQSTDKSVCLEAQTSLDHIVVGLKSYMHACINANMMEKAHNTFVWYRYRLLKTPDTSAPVLDASAYNVLLKSWANSGKVNKVKELFRLMALANVTPTMRSYSYYMLALARQPVYDEEQVRKLAQEMVERELQIEKLFHNSVLTSDQINCTEKMLLTVFPDLKLKRGPLIERSDVVLLKDYRGSHFPQRLGSSLSYSDLKNMCAEQTSIEKSGFVKLKRVYVHPGVSDDEEMRKIWDKHEIEWRNVLKEKISGNLLIYKNRHMELQGINIYPYLVSLDVNDLTEIVIQHLTNLDCITEHHSPPSCVLYRMLGSRVESKYLTNAAIRNGMFADRQKVFSRYLQDLVRSQNWNSRQLVLRRGREMGIGLVSDYREMLWPSTVTQAVGRFLYDIILNDLKVNANAMNRKESVKSVPVIFSFYKTDKQKLREEVRPHPIFSRLQKSICGSELIFEAMEMPMLCPPLPWLTPNTGGYLITPIPFVREFQRSSVRNVPNKSYVAVMDATNSLQLQPWIVNQSVCTPLSSVLLFGYYVVPGSGCDDQCLPGERGREAGHPVASVSSAADSEKGHESPIL